jgi:hypothetical protein
MRRGRIELTGATDDFIDRFDEIRAAYFQEAGDSSEVAL